MTRTPGLPGQVATAVTVLLVVSALAVAPTAAQTLSITFEDQTTTGGEVTVANARGGSLPFFYVAVWSLDGGRLDEVLGFVQVPTNRARDIEVELDPPIDESRTLAATIVPDGDGNPATVDPLFSSVRVRDDAAVRFRAAPTASVAFDDQTSNGSSVTVASAANTSSPFYVAVWTVDESTGEPSSLEGLERINGTSARNVVVDLPRGINESGTLLAALHPDRDGDPDTTDPGFETILASDTAVVTVERPTPTVTVEDQVTDGTSVVVESATNEAAPFYVGVWSTARTASGSLDATLLGTVQVTDTRAENVTVPLARPLSGDTSVAAVVYPDADGEASTTDDPALARVLASDTANVTVGSEP